MRYLYRYLPVLIILTGMMGAGFVLKSDTYFQIKKNFTIFSEVYENISSIYINEVNPDRVFRRGIDAMLNELDPYTVLIDEAESQQMDVLTTGTYAGVGLEVGARGGQLVVIAPLEGYSAERQGVRAGDVIRKVDHIDVSLMSADDLQSLLRGEPGSTVTIVLERYGIEELLEFELERETIEVHNVSYYAFLESDSRIGYILLRRFANNAAKEVREAIVDLQSRGPLDGLVLDLRNNPGGMLGEAVKIIDKFVPAGTEVVWTEGRLDQANQQYETFEEPVYPDKPLAILQNHGSASASEIVSGALQDLDRAIIIGERSFGKGLVQVVQPLSYNVSLKITTSKYFIPSGRSIQSTPFITGNEVEAIRWVPDSLRTRFETKSGRTVYEGIGIEPDVAVEERKQSMLEIALLQNSHYFFFANEYVAGIDTFREEGDPGVLYTEFLNYLSELDFQYTTRAERHINRFRQSLDRTVKEEYEDRIKAMEELIDREKALEKEREADHIRRELYLELISRFEGRSGRIREQLKTDRAALKTLELLENPDRYASIIKP